MIRRLRERLLYADESAGQVAVVVFVLACLIIGVYLLATS